MLHQPHGRQHFPNAGFAVGKPQNDKFYGSALLFRHFLTYIYQSRQQGYCYYGYLEKYTRSDWV